MKRLLLYTILAILLSMSVFAVTYHVPVSTATRIYVPCYNASNGVLVGSSANLNLYDSAGNNDVASQAMTNVATGLFYYSINLGLDVYSGTADCQAGAVDTPVVVIITNIDNLPTDPADDSDIDTQLAAIDDYVDTEVAAILADTGTDGVVLANDAITAAKIATAAIGADEIATDAIGAAEIAANAIGASEIATDAIGAAELAANSITASEIADNAIDAGAIATDAITASEIAADAVGASEAGFLTDSTAFNGADIAAILTDTGAYDTDGEYATAIWNAATVTYGGAGTYGQAVEDTLADTNELQTNQGNWVTAVGFSTHSAADVWTSGTRTLTTADWTTDSDITNQNTLIQGAILGNATNIITTGNSAWITAVGFSTHSAADVDNLISDELIQGALDGNLSSILTDTNEIQSNQSSFITATGFSTHAAADVWSVSTRALTELDEDNTAIDLDSTSVSATVSISAADINSIANATAGYALNTTGKQSTRWTLAWYLDRIYRFP